MNLLDVVIIEVIKEPYLKQEGFVRYWETIVLTDCWGTKKERKFRALSKKDLEHFKVGYKWQE